jgi:hypothetical protein
MERFTFDGKVKEKYFASLQNSKVRTVVKWKPGHVEMRCTQ